MLEQYAGADGVLIWRMWVLCREQCVALAYGSLVCLSFTLGECWKTSATFYMNHSLYKVCIFATIGLRATTRDNTTVSKEIDFFQVATLIMSLLSNILSTTAIWVYLW